MARSKVQKAEATPEAANPKEKGPPYVCVTFAPPVMVRVKEEAVNRGVPVSALVRQAVVAHLSGEKPPISAAVVEGLLSKIEDRLTDLDRRVDSIAINAVRAADRVGSIGKAD